jgi:uncharacterized protein
MFLLLLAVLLSKVAHTQSEKFVTDHQKNLKILSQAKDSLYSETLRNFDVYVKKNPADDNAQLERCRFIQQAYYDAAEDYNPNYDLAKACADSLLKTFPDSPQVLLYQTEFIYSDTLESYLISLEDRASNDDNWNDYRWNLYKLMAEHFHYAENYKKSSYYGDLAMNENDTLDLTLMLGEAHKNLSNNSIAIGFLTSNLDSSATAWELNRKGSLLLELGAVDDAIKAFKLASKKGEFTEDAGELAKALIEKGLFQDAREYLFKDVQSSGSWEQDQKRHALLKYDLKYGTADSAQTSYSTFVRDNFFNDAFAIYRLQLLMKAPFSGWSFADVGRVSLLIFLIVAIIIIPYIWILPIHYLGNYQRRKGWKLPEGTFKWGLRHFWIASSLWIFFDILASLIFDYPGTISQYFNESIQTDFYEGVSKTMADINIFFFTCSLIFCIGMLKDEDIKGFFGKIKQHGNSIGLGIGLAFILKIGTTIYVLLLQGFGMKFDHSTSSIICSVQDHIISINTFYNPGLGFLFVVILVPFYEEILFRGIFLSATERNMKFVFANILQSTVFALVHQDWKFFPFYFAFGMLAGYYTFKTKSLIASTSMHMMNNLLAFLFLLNR